MISKKKLQQNVGKTKSETKSALQLIFDNLNHGQRKKLIKNTEVKKLLEFYEII